MEIWRSEGSEVRRNLPSLSGLSHGDLARTEGSEIGRKKCWT